MALAQGERVGQGGMGQGEHRQDCIGQPRREEGTMATAQAISLDGGALEWNGNHGKMEGSKEGAVPCPSTIMTPTPSAADVVLTADTRSKFVLMTVEATIGDV